MSYEDYARNSQVTQALPRVKVGLARYNERLQIALAANSNRPSRLGLYCCSKPPSKFFNR